jgi:succinoglycan biosynthesis transport protein ExoP
MNHTEKQIISPLEVINVLKTNVKLWLLPAVVCGVVAAVYSVVKTPSWEASQALIVREEATSGEENSGKFTSNDEMKTVQETILELAKSRGVLEAALKEIGPADDAKAIANWPTSRDVSGLRKSVTLTPPKGAEFGMTEVFYLKVESNDRDRAIALAGAIADQADYRFRQLRDEKAQSMINELGNSVEIAQTDLQESTTQLSKIEIKVGGDLAELRGLSDSVSGDGALAQTGTEIRSEMRQIQANEKNNKQLLSLLKEAKNDAGRLLATPNGLLESQPALRRLKDGLVDAQLQTARLKGNMSNEHPFVKAALEAEEQIGQHLHNELDIAIRGIHADLRMNSDRAELLNNQLAEVNSRLEQLAGLRAEYVNRVSEASGRAALVARAEQNLSEARAVRASANATSLISRIDTPEAGNHPVGPSRSMVTIFGMAGGLMVGFGLVFLTAQPVQSTPPSASAKHRTRHEAPARRDTSDEAIEPLTVARPIKRRSRANGNLSLKEALQQLDINARV